MANLNPISYENVLRAGAIINSASGREHAPRVDYPPFIEEAVAGAAMALEKGHPHALRLAHKSTAEEWLDPNSMEGRHFHRAVARVLGGYEPGALVNMSPKGIMEHIVTDTVNTTLANRMELAVMQHHPVMVEEMTPQQVQNVEIARLNPQYAAQIQNESRGAYEGVSHARKVALIDVFHTMENVSDVAKAQIDLAAKDIEEMRVGAAERGSYVNDRLADFKEAGVPLFREGRPLEDRLVDANWRTQELERGAGAGPMNEVEAGVAAHILVAGPQNLSMNDPLMHDARVNVMANMSMLEEGASALRDPALTSPHAVAMRVEGMSRLMREADDYGYSFTRAVDDDEGKALDMQCLAHGEPSSMSPEAQVRVFETLHSGDRVPALTAMRLHEAVRDLSGVYQAQLDVERNGILRPVAHAAAQGRDQGAGL